MILDAAQCYAQRGWPVFPCEPRGKRPLTRNGFKDASTDTAQIRAWWKRNPNANVAIPTGARTFDVLDIDGPEGEQSLSEMEARHDELPAGPRQITGRGRQLWFRGGSLMQSAGRLPGIDTRGEGGYVVVAPSVHPTGAIYTLEDDGEPLPEPPAWLLMELRGEGMARELPLLGPPVHVEDATARTLLAMAGIPLALVPTGQRNDRIFRWGASLRARGQDQETILGLLRIANAHLCKPSLIDEELQRIAHSAARLAIAPAYTVGVVAAERATERAVASAQDARASEEASSAVASGDLEAQLETARKLLRIDLLGVVQSGKTLPTYYLRVPSEDGKAEDRLRIPNLLSYSDVKRRIFDHMGVVVGVRAKEWEAAAALLRAVAQPEDPGLADEREATRHLLESFLREKSATVAETEDELRQARVAGCEVIQFEGSLWFAFDAFSSWADRSGVRDGFQALWRRLVEAGDVREAARTFRHGGKVVNRRYWVATGGLT